MVHVWTAYVAVTGLPLVPVLPAKGVVATESMLVTRLPVVTAYAVTAKAVGPALSMVQDDVALLAVHRQSLLLPSWTPSQPPQLLTSAARKSQLLLARAAGGPSVKDGGQVAVTA